MDIDRSNFQNIMDRSDSYMSVIYSKYTGQPVFRMIRTPATNWQNHDDMIDEEKALESDLVAYEEIWDHTEEE